MSPIRPRVFSLSLAAALAVSAATAASPSLAAGSPEAAVDALFDLVERRDFSRLDEVACEAERDAAREAFDLAGSLGLDPDDPVAGALSIEFADRSVEVVAQEGDTASVSVTVSMAMSVPEDQVEELVRAMLEQDLGPDDPPVSEDDVEMMLGFMGSALNRSQTIEQDVTVVREDGEWLVCSAFVDEPEEPDVGLEPVVSSEGLCAIAAPAELDAVGALDYDSSRGFGFSCAFSNSDFEDFSSTGVALQLDADLESMAQAYGMEASERTTLAGLPAASSTVSGGGFADQLLVQVDGDVLIITVTPGEDPPADFDPLAEATAVAELLIPRIPDLRLALVGPTPAPTPEPTPEVSLCEALPLDELNAATGLGFDDASGSGSDCSYTDLDMEAGFSFVTAFVYDASTLEMFAEFLPDLEDATVAGLPALVGDQGSAGTYKALVELPQGERVVDVNVVLQPADGEPPVTADALAVLLAERIVAFLAAG